MENTTRIMIRILIIRFRLWLKMTSFEIRFKLKTLFVLARWKHLDWKARRL